MDGLRSADGSVVYSDFVRDHHLINGLPRPEVLPLFVPEIPPPQPLPDTGPVLFAGRLILPKGVMLLLRAVALLDIELVIAGSGYAQAAMEKFVRTHRLADRVRFAGWQSVEGLSALYRRSSSVVFPSILPEGFGLAGIEALAAHRPVVATLRGGMSEWLIPDETGLAVPSLDARDLADALDRLSGDRQLRRELAANGYALVKERFSADRFVLEASRMYRSLLATREPKGRQRIASGAAPHLDA
jgi:glycosyltransferase involved in cell wall biosynthesis